MDMRSISDFTRKERAITCSQELRHQEDSDSGLS